MLWWHWILLGVALLVTDIALINVYYLLWFGLGALVVGLALLAAPELSPAAQIITFGVVSAGFLALWLAALRPHIERRSLASAREEIIGISARVVRFANGSGTLRLQKPVGGRDVWKFTAGGDTLRAGDAVHIIAMDDSGVLQAAPPEHSS